MGSDVYLDLLLRDAAEVEYEEPVLAARRRGEAPEAIAALERTKLRALRLRTVLAHRRRREIELTALFQTASDLAGLRDLDAVLRAIVRRARRLLETDAAYMTLEDPARGDTYMRVTDGSVAATFQSLRLPMGAGLGGLVAQTAAPYVTADYRADARFRHTGEIDGAVFDEGLVAILGVPLRVGTRVIGVLFAADRREREFAQEETALLGSLADHAAIAIDNARMLHETQVALAELDAASRLRRERAAAVERAAAAHDRLTDLVLRGGGLAQLATAVTEVLSGSVRVLDGEGAVLAGTGDPACPEVTEAIAASRETGRAVRRGDHWVAPVVAGQEHLGALVLRTGADLDDADQRILERAALVTALLLLFRRSVADAESRVRGDLLGDILLAPDRDPPSLRDRARRLGVDLDEPHIVLALVPAAGLRQRLGTELARLADARGGLATRHDGREVLLLPGTDPAATARSVVAGLRRTATAGAAGTSGGPDGIAAAHREAVRCLDALLALGRTGEGVAMSELGFVGLVLGEHQDIDGFIASAVGPLLEYDRRRGTRLVETLAAYFAAGRSPLRAHQALHVHVNTVNQRLDRVTQLLGPTWQDVDRALEIQLALRLHRIRG